jgi:hypothetical protein
VAVEEGDAGEDQREEHEFDGHGDSAVPSAPISRGEPKGRAERYEDQGRGLPLIQFLQVETGHLMLRSGLRRGGKSNSVEHGGGRTPNA